MFIYVDLAVNFILSEKEERKAWSSSEERGRHLKTYADLLKECSIKRMTDGTRIGNSDHILLVEYEKIETPYRLLYKIINCRFERFYDEPYIYPEPFLICPYNLTLWGTEKEMNNRLAQKYLPVRSNDLFFKRADVDESKEVENKPARCTIL